MILTKRNKKPPRRERRRTAETVVRTHLAVITGVGNSTAGISVRREIELVKASLLYADTVEVLSIGSQMVRNLHRFAAGDTSNIWALMLSLDDATLRNLGFDGDPDDFRQAITFMATADPDGLRSASAADPSLREFTGFADLLEEGQTRATSAMAEMRQIYDKMRVDSGVAELEGVLDTKLVRFNEQVPIGEDLDAAPSAFVNQIKRYLRDPSSLVLLDGIAANMARHMIEEGVVQPPNRVISNAEEAVLGTGFLERHLPAFPGAPMDELLDLRRDLEEPLGRYRRKVSSLRSELQTGPFDENINAEIAAIWRLNVAPEIADIRKAMADHSLVREFIKAAGGDVTSLVKGTLGAGIGVITANTFDLGTTISAGITAGGAIGPPAVGALIARHERRSEALANDLYYLYEVDRRLK
jgi:hypothetical protein